MRNIMSLHEMQLRAYGIAKANGFHDSDVGPEEEVRFREQIVMRLALIHSEVSEALEALRKGDMENFAEELADIIIRIGDMAEPLDIHLGWEVQKKMQRNESRPRMHGKKF